MKEKDKIEVHKIDIKIGDKTISLKPGQAKELKKILNDMFEEHPGRVDHYWWNWPQPSHNLYTYYPGWTIKASATTGAYCGGSGNYTSALGTSDGINSGTVTLALAT